VAGSATDEYNPKRTPSWTDRVLFMCNAHAGYCALRPMYYTSLRKVGVVALVVALACSCWGTHLYYTGLAKGGCWCACRASWFVGSLTLPLSAPPTPPDVNPSIHHHQVKDSDHKPVVAGFELTLTPSKRHLGGAGGGGGRDRTIGACVIVRRDQ
jgi:hypothetical protein